MILKRVKVEDVRPYPNNPRRNDNAVDAVAESIRQCGYRLSKEDIVNCQSFPQDYDFGTQSPQYVCGMSVPPVMMANIAAEIKKQFFGK